MKSEKEKAAEVLKERERARKGFAVTDDEGRDPLPPEERATERQEKAADAGVALGLGMKR
jgi:hypothetical protein